MDFPSSTVRRNDLSYMDRLQLHDSMKSANHNNVQTLAMETAFSMVLQDSVLSTLTPLPLVRYVKYRRSWRTHGVIVTDDDIPC
jgi:hypothetical protein